MPAGKLKSIASDCEGSALVEGAVLLPLLFALVFGVYEFSWFFYQQHLAAVGVSDAARFLARVSMPCDESSPIWAGEQVQARNLATTGSITGGALRVKGWTSEMVMLRCTPVDNPVGASGLNAYRGNPIVHVITVSSRFTDPSLGFFSLLRLRPPSISVSHSERAIGRG